MTNTKVAIVTGGSRGIGAALAQRLIDLEYNVFVNDVTNSESLSKTVEELNKNQQGVKAFKAIGDVSKYEDCEAVVQKAINEFGQLNVLVNNAGIVNTGLFADIPKEKYIKCVEIDLLGTMHMSHVAIPYLLEQDRSDIVNISSIMGISAEATNTDYVAAKHGVIGFTRGLAKDYADRNLCVNAICPGVTKTEILDDADPEALEAVVQGIPMGKIGEVDDMADTLEYFLRATFTTGQYISPNGGSTMV